MNAKVKRRVDDSLRTIPSENGRMVILECEVYDPKSLAGKTVYVFCDERDVTELLLEFRDAARRARS